MRGIKDNSELKTLFGKNRNKSQENIKEEFTAETIKPMKYNLINLNVSGYRIITREKFLEMMLVTSEISGSIKTFTKLYEKAWEEVRNGYEFAILIGNELIDVDSFNEIVLGGKKSEEENKEIKISFDDLITGKVVVEGAEAQEYWFMGTCAGIELTRKKETNKNA